MKLSEKRAKEGTTLVEVILAIIILAVIAMAGMTALRYPRYRAVADANRQVAVIVANTAMEQAKSMGYNSVSNVAGTYALSDIATRNSMNGSSVSGSREVEDLNADGSDYKRVTVEINYDGSDQPVVVQTLIYP